MFRLKTKLTMPLIMGVLIFAEMASAFETLMVYAALKHLSEAFQTQVGVGWLITIYLLGQTVSAAIGGRLGDMFGRRRVMIVVFILAAVGSAISAWAHNFETLLFGRAIQGVAGAVLPLCYGLVAEYLPAKRAPLGIGIISGTAVICSGLGLVAGGIIVDQFGWRYIFWFSVVLCLVSIALALLFLPHSQNRRPEGRIDIIGGVLFVPAIVLILWAASNANAFGWTSPVLWGAVIGGAGLAVFWYFFERAQKEPLIDTRLLSDKRIALADLCMLLLGMSAIQIPLVMSMLLQQPMSTGVGLGLSATVAGLLILPSNLVGVVGGPLSGHLASRHGSRLPLLVGLMATATGWGGVLVWHNSMPIVFLSIISAGAGMSFVYAALSNVVIASAPRQRASEASGQLVVARGLGQSIGAQLIAIMLASSTAPGATHLPSLAAYQLVFGFVVVMVLLSACIAWMLPSKVGAVADAASPGMGAQKKWGGDLRGRF